MSERAPLPIRILPHLFLVVVLVIEALVWSGRHQGDAELEVVASEGTSRERIWALHVLTNRHPDDRGFDAQFVKGLMNDPDPLVADLAYTIDVCRLQRPIWQESRLTKPLKGNGKARDEVQDWWRRFVIFRRKVGGRIVGGTLRLRREEIGWYFAALRGEPLDREALAEHANERQAGSYVVRQQRDEGGESNPRKPQAGLVPGREKD